MTTDAITASQVRAITELVRTRDPADAANCGLIHIVADAGAVEKILFEMIEWAWDLCGMGPRTRLSEPGREGMRVRLRRQIEHPANKVAPGGTLHIPAHQ